MTDKATCMTALANPICLPVVSSIEATSLPDDSFVEYHEPDCTGDCCNETPEPQLLELTVDEVAEIIDSDIIDITEAPTDIILFEDDFVGSAGSIDGHLVDIPASTSWLNDPAKAANPARVIELDGSGNATNNIDFIDELTDCVATAVVDGSSTPKEITHNGSVELTVDITVPSADINQRSLHVIHWLSWTSGLFVWIAGAQFFILGSSKIRMDFSRGGEDPDENVLSDNEISFTNQTVTPDVPIRLGWTISADMADVELWWAPLSNLADKTVLGSASGVHGPYTANQGNVTMAVAGTAGDGTGTPVASDLIHHIMIVQH